LLDLMRRVAVLTVVSAIGIGLLVPLTARSATPDEIATLRLLHAAEAAAGSLDGVAPFERGTTGSRSASASLSLATAWHGVGPELLDAAGPGDPPSLTLEATIYRIGPAIVAPPPITGDEITGRATWYCCTRGYRGEAVVALPGALGGRYDPAPASRYVTVCGDRCVRLPVVDYCSCAWGTTAQKVVDLSPEAWAAVTDSPLSRGVVTVTVHLSG
jgi:hypothetical protein